MIGYWAFSVAYSSAKTMSGNRFRMFTDKAVLVDQNRPGRLVTRHSHALDIVALELSRVPRRDVVPAASTVFFSISG